MSERTTGPFVLLDDNRAGVGKRLLFRAPLDIIACHDYGEVDALFQQLEAALARGHYVAGWIAYEAGYALEPKLRPIAPVLSDMPLAWFGVFTTPDLAPAHADRGGAVLVDDITPSVDKARYETAIAAIKNYLLAGDVYQINFTFPLHFSLQGWPDDLFTRLRRAQPVAYGAHIHNEDWDILSLSPELFFQKRGPQLTARPMKGTAPRGRTLEEDRNIADALRGDAKSQAENLMIVDLLRNDLSRLAQPGSVEVPALFDIETYRTLLQMTSTVSAEIDTQAPLKILFKSLFPCGSVTGAPKIRAMEIIRDLEQPPRGVYTGAIGYITPERDMTFSVPIRTLTLKPDKRRARTWQGSLGIGSGIVIDSVADAEYQECLLKAAFLTTAAPAFDLVETLRWQPDGGFLRLDAHVQRLTQSATYFRFTVDRDAIGVALADLAASLPPTPHRVRLLLSERGVIALTATPLSPAPESLRLCVSNVVINSRDAFLYHKTTARTPYQQALREAQAQGCFEAVLTNERGEVTEGSFTTIFVERDGVLLTPPLSAGLLPGILRAELLKSGRAREATLYPADLRSADRLYIGNSLRGLMAVSELASRNNPYPQP